MHACVLDKTNTKTLCVLAKTNTKTHHIMAPPCWEQQTRDLLVILERCNKSLKPVEPLGTLQNRSRAKRINLILQLNVLLAGGEDQLPLLYTELGCHEHVNQQLLSNIKTTWNNHRVTRMQANFDFFPQIHFRRTLLCIRNG